MLSTYLLRRQGEPSEPMKGFIERVKDGPRRSTMSQSFEDVAHLSVTTCGVMCQ